MGYANAKKEGGESMLLVFHTDLYAMCAATEGSFGFRIYTCGDKSFGK